MSRTCPDCDVPLEAVDYDADYEGNMLRLKEGGGLLGKLGIRGGTNVIAYLCPQCRRVLFYAD